MTTRPAWFDASVFPVQSQWLDLDGHAVHYVDQGSGPTLLMLHGNPMWSFLYRRMIAGLSDRFRCVALDYPGFGLSAAAPGYGFTVAEHSAVVRRFVAALDLTDVVVVVQDWGGPIGIGALQADPDRYRGIIIGNTWAWPAPSRMRPFSEILGGRITGGLITERANGFVRVVMPQGFRRRRLTDPEKAMYRGPFDTLESRRPVRMMPQQIFGARPFLQQLADGLDGLAELPALLLWADGDVAFQEAERARWQQVLGNRTDYTLHGAGHFWQDDAGEEACLVVRDWWGRAFGDS
jgi:haloalkane dehalogenase